MRKSNKNSRAFCEGRQAKAWGDEVNPHPSGSEAFDAWATGYALEIATGVQGPCNLRAGISVPDLSGRTLSQATADLLDAELCLGTVTNLDGTVTDQSIAAATVVKPGSFINITLSAIAIPDVVGMTEAEAEIALIAAGFIKGTVTNTAGVVTLQDPVAGEPAVLGDAVDITLFGVAVPDLVGRTEEEATGDLTMAGLDFGTVTVERVTQIVGEITVQDPEAGAIVELASTVDVTLLGVTVPNLAGRTEIEALGDLTDVGLIGGTVTNTAGEVTAQDPDAGVAVALGSAVDFTLFGIICPELVDMTEEEATLALIAEGLILGTVTNTAGDVTAQDPESGAAVALGSAVDITLLGVAVPDVVDLTQANAEIALIADGLILGTVTNTAGNVTSQDPAAGTPVVLGAAIDITLLGVAVPDVVTMTEANAEIALVADGLILGTVTNTAGAVTSQDPVSGVAVALGTAVDITLLGVAVPDVVAMTEVNAEIALVADGLILGTVTLTTGPVTIQSPAAGTAVALGTAVNITLTS